MLYEPVSVSWLRGVSHRESFEDCNAIRNQSEVRRSVPIILRELFVLHPFLLELTSFHSLFDTKKAETLNDKIISSNSCRMLLSERNNHDAHYVVQTEVS